MSNLILNFIHCYLSFSCTLPVIILKEYNIISIINKQVTQKFQIATPYHNLKNQS